MIEPITPVELTSRAKMAERTMLQAQPSLPQKAEDQGSKEGGSQPTTQPTPRERMELRGALTETYAQFVYDDKSRLMMVKIVDATTKRVVREIPPEALAKLAEAMRAYQDVGAGLRTPGQAGGQATPEADTSAGQEERP